MNNPKFIRADVVVGILDDLEAALEILSSEIPIETPRRQKIEQALKNFRATIAKLRAKLPPQ